MNANRGRWALVAAAPCVAAWCAAAPEGQPAGPSEAAARVSALLDEDFEAQMRASPVRASLRGDRRFDHLLPDNSPAAIEAVHAAEVGRLAAIRAVPRDGLDEGSTLDAALLEYDLSMRTAQHQFAVWQADVTQIGGPQRWIPDMVTQLSFDDDVELGEFVARLELIDAYLRQEEANLRAGMAGGNVPPRLVVAGAADQALAHGLAALRRDGARGHMLFRPFEGREDALADRAAAAIEGSVAPAFERFGVFLRDEYEPACRESIAASDRPGGRALYDFQVRLHTTLDLTADEVHTIGLGEVDRIRREMFAVIDRTDFPSREALEGDGLFDAFVEYLRTDARFYYTDPDDLLDGYRAIGKRIDAELPSLFGVLPRLAWGVREMPPFIARSSPTAYYYPGSIENGVAGYFVANTHRLDQRPKYEMVALTLHEAVPGHHFQGAISQELEQRGVHRWRTLAWYTAFSEGWALYAEKLGLEMEVGPQTPRGMFSDPYDDFGRLSYEMWRAMRLVVDTGIHAKGWSRDRAVGFMLANSALARENIEREVDRYIAWPGQALGYKVGEMKILELRRRAESALGDRFDLRAFHDEVLGAGSLPLGTLESRIDAWIAARAT